MRMNSASISRESSVSSTSKTLAPASGPPAIGFSEGIASF